MADDPAPTGIVVVSFGSHELVRANLAAFDPPADHFRVIVVDNFSGPAERAAIAEQCADRGWTMVGCADNLGFGRGVDAGIQAAIALGCRTIILVNPDAILDLSTADALRAAVIADPDALVAPSIVGSAGQSYFHGAELDLTTGRTRGMLRTADGSVRRRVAGPAQDWISGACVAFSTELLTRVGGVGHAADDYFLYWEDVDLSHRVLADGGRLIVRPDLTVIHDEGGTQDRPDARAKSATYYYWNARNRLVFAARNLSAADFRRWVWRTPQESWVILMRGGRRQLVQSPGLAWATIRGSLAGIITGRRMVRRRHRRGGSVPSATAPRILIAHPGAELYGSDRVMIETAVALLEAGAQVTVTVPEDGPLVAELLGRGVRVTICPAPVLRKSALRPRGALELVRTTLAGARRSWRLTRVDGRDGVYVSTITIPSWIVLGRLLRRPVTCHVHEAETGISSFLQRMLTAPVLLAPSIVVNSQFSARVLAAAWPSIGRRAVLVANPVPGPEHPAPARNPLGTPARLLFIGRLSPRKGPQVAVEVVAALRSAGRPVQLTLLGSAFTGYEWFVDELQAAVQTGGLADVVEFAGFDTDVWAHFARADVVLIPSQADEPFGNTAVEAVLAARPVVSSANGGLVEAVAGYASAQPVPPTDVAAWASAVSAVLDDWNRFTELAAADAAVAGHRHDPAAYRRRMRDLLLPAGGPAAIEEATR